MVKRIPCTVVSSAFTGQTAQRNRSRQPPVMNVSKDELMVLEDDKEPFPSGIFVDIIIGD